mmetsp:Transcript_9027/g.17803  ORF Transcript_9027/g.17803 Transcript_9027/m.17803 type:complete len:636 (-) Transcript_9027:474-2381(-)|eukprot:CAMPEP_0171500182 /NCGR_PEP_ID=MMETSP0958-20121227/8844_1 /TAXON_ID=87120 /ORGANISM="Aurantiochytrium limacinum, Strain ATCCMYA-1381" /LENGTH=635 /DNA_ID=CAMNT_0012034825 /DNA_START=265 /DNA_END=2172 /DNA_ORIENTATION=-
MGDLRSDGRALCAFNQSGDAFVQVTSDNRIALWDVATGAQKQTQHEKDHLTQRYSCMAFQCSGSKQLVATGNSHGQVSVWNMADGSRLLSGVQVPNTSVAEAVADVCFSADASRLFACGAQSRYVYEFLLEEGAGVVGRKFKVGKSGCAKLCVSSDGKRMLTAGTGIKLWDLESGTRLQRFAGHSTPVRSLVFAEDASCFASSCEDRVVSLWKLTSSRKSAKKKASENENEDEDDEASTPLVRDPAVAFALASPPVSLAMVGKKKALLLSACCEDGRTAVCRASLASSAAKKAQATPDHEILTPASGRTVCANVLADEGEEQVVLARSTSLRPVFEKLKVDELPAKKELADVSSSTRLLQKGGVIIDDDDDEDMEDVEEKRKEKAAAKEKLHVVKDSKTGLANPRVMNGVDEDEEAKDEEDERTLGERVRELTAALQERVQSVGNDDSDSDSEEGEDGENSKRRKRQRDQPGTAGSLSTVLEQALQSNDDQLLEVCLRNQDKKVIDATVQRLTPRRAVQFLNAVVVKLEARPARGQALLLWIRAVLEQHAMNLVKVADLPDVLGALYQVIDARLAVFNKFLKLSGRLDFILSQVALQTAQGDEEAAADRAAPSMIYDEEAPVEEKRSKKKKKIAA